MSSEFTNLLPLTSSYVAEAVRNQDREGHRPPLSDVNGLVWRISCCLEAGVHLKGEGTRKFNALDIEALMGDRKTFPDTIEARALRQVTRLVLRETSGLTTGHPVSVKAAKGIDLDNITPPAKRDPKFSLKSTRSPHRLILYSLIEEPLDLDDPEWLRRRADLRSFVLSSYFKLPRSDRRIVGLRAIVGLSWDEIAERTEIPRTTAWRKYYSALKRLERAIDDWSRDEGIGGPAHLSQS